MLKNKVSSLGSLSRREKYKISFRPWTTAPFSVSTWYIHIFYCRAQSLEVALKEREKSLEEYKAKFDKLKEDFKYNLKLLKERDAELSKYDSQSVGEL